MTDIESLKLEFSERTRPIVFWTGAGISVPTIPMWSALRDQLLDSLKNRAKSLNGPDQKSQLIEHAQIKSTSDLWLQFERLEKSLGRETYVQRIKESLSASEKAVIPKIQLKLWELAPTGMVTLNLDLFTQRAIASHPSQAIPITIAPGKFGDHLNVLRERRPFIAYPHGHLDNPSLWTFTRAELDKRLTDSGYLEWMTVLTRAATIVFVGVTADDVAIGSLLERVVANRVPLTGHYWITARDDTRADHWAGRARNSGH